MVIWDISSLLVVTLLALKAGDYLAGLSMFKAIISSFRN